MQTTARKIEDAKLFENPDELMTYDDLARVLQTTTRTLRRYVALGKIPFVRIDGWAVRFDKSEIAAWLRRKNQRRR